MVQSIRVVDRSLPCHSQVRLLDYLESHVDRLGLESAADCGIDLEMGRESRKVVAVEEMEVEGRGIDSDLGVVVDVVEEAGFVELVERTASLVSKIAQ